MRRRNSLILIGIVLMLMNIFMLFGCSTGRSPAEKVYQTPAGEVYQTPAAQVYNK